MIVLFTKKLMPSVNGYLLNFTIIMMMITYSYSLNNDKTDLKRAPENNEMFNFKKMFEALTTIFLSGLFDRSFFITAFMAIKYSKCLVMTSASFALSLVGVLSVFLGVAITNYIPTIWIETLAVALFLFFGVRMMIEGHNMPKNQDLKNLEESSRQFEEDAETLVNKKLPHDKAQEHGHSHGILEIQKECTGLASTANEKESVVKIFFKIFLLIFASELGDRSQISTIYLTSNFDKIIVIFASVIAQVTLTAIAIFGGVLISTKISERNLTFIAGSTFILFGIVALFLLIKDDLLIVNTPDMNLANVSSASSNGSSLTLSNQLIPDKQNLISTY